MYSVSSAFTSLASAKNAQWSRQLIFGTSDYSNMVLQWPIVNRTWNNVNPTTITLDLSNDNGAFNFLLNNPTQLQNSANLNLGFSSLAEYVTLFSGTIDAVQYSGNKISLTLVDKFKKLADRVIGDATTPTAYTSSNYLVHDFAWYACTSMGGLSAITSTSNPDIDYTSWSSWSSVFSADNTRVRANLTGQKVVEILQKLSNLTQSAIWIENNKIKFSRFSIADAPSATFDDSTVVDTIVTLDNRLLVNQMYVGAGYNVTSRSFAYTVNAINSNSVGSYGLHQDNSMETAVWLVDSTSALNLAQRVLNTKQNIIGDFNVSAPLMAIPATIGDVFLYSDTHLGISVEGYRCLSETIDMENGLKTYNINQTQLSNAFRLDFSSLDSSDLLV